MSKYANGKPVDIPEEKSDQEIAIKEWAEGNLHLENALRQCIANGIITIASCAGHNETISGNNPYLAIEITDETRRRVYNIFNTVFKARKDVSSFDISTDFHDGRTRTILAIHAKSKDKIFELIAEGAMGEIDLESCHPIVQRMVEVAQRAKELELGYHALRYCNIGFIKAIVFLNNTIENNSEIYKEAGIKHPINLHLTDQQILEQLGDVLSAMGVPTNEVKTNYGLISKIRDALIKKVKPASIAEQAQLGGEVEPASIAEQAQSGGEEEPASIAEQTQSGGKVEPASIVEQIQSGGKVQPGSGKDKSDDRDDR